MINKQTSAAGRGSLPPPFPQMYLLPVWLLKSLSCDRKDALMLVMLERSNSVVVFLSIPLPRWFCF